MRKLLTFLFAALMSVGMFALTPQSGDTWDDATKTLTVNSNPGNKAYESQTEIEHVIISDAVTSIGNYAFLRCTGLTSVTIPNSVTSIGQGAFQETGLTSIEIPGSVTSIGHVVFFNCSGLETVTILAESLESYGNDVFFNTHANLKIYVPAGSVDTYKGAWTAYANKIEAIPPATVAVTGVTLNQNEAQMTVGGETLTLSATVNPEGATDKSVTWSSSNTSVATVSNEGVVTAVAAGEATITVTATNGTDVTTDDQTATCTVTVAEPTYTVSLKEGTADAAKWQGKAGTGEYQALPLTGLEAGTALTVKYDGRKRVTSVKAVKKGGALATPLTMEALTDGNIMVGILDPNDMVSVELVTGMKYSVNGGEKTTITTTTTINVNTGDKVQLYGNSTSTQVYVVMLQGTAQTKAYGNIMSLIDETGYATLTTLPNQSSVFMGLFAGNANLTDASGLLLPATTLAGRCYAYMFSGCTGLTTAPTLPATTLAEACYYSMFAGCTSLNSVTCLATDISADGCTSGWLDGVATTGTFTKASGSTWPEGSSGIPSGWTVNEQ